MNISKWNQKVAISRWNKKHSEEMSKIGNDTEAFLLKAAICGFLAGDGSVQKRKEKNNFHYQIDFFPDDCLTKDTYIKQVKKVYKKTPSVRKKNNFYAVRITSKVIAEDLFKIADFGIKKWTVPEALFSIKGAKENWLKAFFSSEAYVSSRSIKIQTVNEKGISDIAKMLKNMSIHSTRYEYEPKKENHSKVFMLFINRKEDRLKFFNKIGFWHKKKTKTLSEALDL